MKKGFVVSSFIVGAICGAICIGEWLGEKIKEKQNLSDKHLSLYLMMNEWVKIKQNGKSLADYFVKNQYKRIAVYGMSYAGKTLIEELKNSEIEVLYGIDKNAKSISADIDIITMEDALREVDAIVITAVTFFNEIEEQLSEKIECPIISLEDVLFEL